MDTRLTKSSYEPFRLHHAIQLAAPHTWCASIMPVLFSVAFSYHSSGSISPLLVSILLVICILMQSSVNAFNDYFDFVRGLDTDQDQLEADDSTLVNDRIDPKCALIFAIALLAVAFAFGVAIIIQCGLIPLWIALAGALIIVLYSGGPYPLSSLPAGELVSGFVMGGLIPLASVFVLTGSLDIFVLLLAMPYVVGIALIMLTNNTCDREKDEPAGRRTFAVLVGREHAVSTYHGALAAWTGIICAYVLIWFQEASIMLPFMILAVIPMLKGMLKNPLTQSSRVNAMAQIVSLNVALGTFYALCIFV